MPSCTFAPRRARFFAFVPAILLLAAAILAACGGDSPDDATPSPDEPPQDGVAEQVEPAADADATPQVDPTDDAPPPSATVSNVDASEARLLPTSLRAADEFGWSGAISGDWMVVSAPFHDRNGPQSGAAYVYKRSGEIWAEHQQLLAFDGQPNDWFARRVAMDGDTLIATAPFADLGEDLNDAGALYVFEREGDSWQQSAKLTGTPAQDGQLFGWSAAIEGDTIVVGANGDTGGLGGVAYVFQRREGQWVQEALLRPDASVPDDDFGFSVGIDGDTIVVGSPALNGPDGDERSGAAFLYQRDGGSWARLAKLTAEPVFPGAEFGTSVSIDGDVIAIGAFHAGPRGEDSGAVYLFDRRAGDWAEGGVDRRADSMLVAADTEAGDWFGYSVALLGDALVVGAPRKDHETLPIIGLGGAYLFERESGWVQTNVLTPDDGESTGEDAGFGWDVWVDDGYVVVGAWLADNDAGIDAGSAYVFRRAGPLPGGEAIAAPSREETPELVVAPVPVELVPALGGVAFEAAVDVAWLPDGRALVAEQGGRLLLVAPDGSQVTTALDLGAAVATQGFEQGLLSVTLDPGYASNGYVWIFYTRSPDGSARLSRVRLIGSAVEAGSELIVLEVEEPFANHNGGTVRFGPDGLLYLGLGDGGAQGDPQGNGQNLATLLGSVIRLDVSQSSQAAPYAIPPQNPFLDTPGARAEIWAYGLRNPWRMAFDQATGLLWVGDVGQDAFEEVNVLIQGGNYGWSVIEGVSCYREDCELDGDELPVSLYGHDLGCSIIGGEVYRGGRIPGLAGAYVFGDFCSGAIWGLGATGTADPFLLLSTDLSIVSFSVDGSGGLYVLAQGEPIQQILPVEKPASAIPPGYAGREG